MAMAMELARVVHQERLLEAESRRWRRAVKQVAAERAAAERSAAADGDAKQTGPKVDWPVFSVRIGRFHLAVFKTVRL